MANPGDLSRGLAKLLGVPEVNVRAHDRILSESGFRRTGGRGRSAPVMRSEDGVRLLIAMMSGGLAKNAASSVETFCSLGVTMQRKAILMSGKMTSTISYREPPSSAGLNLNRVEDLPVHHSLFDMLDALVFAAQIGEIEAAVSARKPIDNSNGFRSIGTWEIEISLSCPTPAAEVTIGCDDVAFTTIYGGKFKAPDDGDFHRQFKVTHRTILGLGSLLRK